jgi:hypothetical protein
MKDNIAYIVERKGKIIKDEMIYGEGMFHRIKIINYQNNLYWINKKNGIVVEYEKIGRV